MAHRSARRQSLTISELLLPVVPGHLDLEHFVLDDVGGQAGQALPAAAADPDQQHVPSRLANHAHDARHYTVT